MHKTQQLVILLGIIFVCAMALYPPWIYTDDNKVGHPMGYGPIWKAPVERQHESASVLGIKFQLDTQAQTANSIDMMRLIMQIGIMALVTGGAVMMLKKT